MNSTIKTIDVTYPIRTPYAFGWIKSRKMAECKFKLIELIKKEYNEFYSNEKIINKYDWSSVDKTDIYSFDFTIKQDKEFIFEIFETTEVSEGVFKGRKLKGKVLEQMIIKINWI